jgi:hypothetical protein
LFASIHAPDTPGFDHELPFENSVLQSENHSMAPRDGPEDNEYTDSQQYSMQPFNQKKCAFRLFRRLRNKPAMKEKRLGDEQHHGEYNPYEHHGVHPPVSGVCESTP